MSLGDKFLYGLAKYVMGPISHGIGHADKFIKEKTGKGVFDRMEEQNKKDEKLKEEKPLLWVAKKIGKGALTGIIGGTLHRD